MSFYKEVPGRQTTLESTLKFDTTPTAGSTNPVTSGAVKEVEEKADAAAEALQEQIDDIAEKAGSGYTPKGEADVATLNGLSGQENGWLYTMTDAGTLTLGSLAVVAGDTVAWDEANSVWYKAMDYAPRQYGTNEVHNLATTITAFRTGDVIPVDGPSGTAKMSKDDLLNETSEKALDYAGIKSENLEISRTYADTFLNTGGGLISGSPGFSVDEFELEGKNGKFVIESGKNLALKNVVSYCIKNKTTYERMFISQPSAVSQVWEHFLYADGEGYVLQVCRRVSDPACKVTILNVKENADESFVATNGSDFGFGTKESPYKSIEVALQKSTNVFVRGGVYFGSSSLNKVNKCNISGYKKEFAKIILSTDVWKSESNHSGDVYKIAATDPQAKFLYQFGVDDVQTEIEPTKRHGLQGQKTYRCDCTAIRRVSSLADVSSTADDYNYHYYADGEYIYFTRPTAVNSINFIFNPSANAAFENTDDKIIHLVGLRFYGGSLKLLRCKYAVVKNCTNGYGRYGITCTDCEHVSLIGCEALRTESANLSDVFGDGISTDSSHSATQKNDFPIMDLLIDGCWSHDNWQDGFSDHYNSRTTIRNSIFEFNCQGGTGAGITPSYGSGDIIVNCISQYNKGHGIKIEADGSTTYSSVGAMTLINCISRHNTADGIESNGENTVECIGCYSYGNSWRGYYTSKALSFRCVDCKGKDNPGGTFVGTIVEQVNF